MMMTAGQEAARAKARALVQLALSIGWLRPEPCAWCGMAYETPTGRGRLTVVAHHPDYRRPLHVQWLCRTHHGAAHQIKGSFHPQKPRPRGYLYRARGAGLLAANLHQAQLERLEAAGPKGEA